MATTYHKIKGKAYWAKVFERNRDTESQHPGVQQKLDETNGQTSIVLLLDEEGMSEFEASGSRRKPRVTDEGPAIQLTRPWEHKIEVFGGPPQVVDAEGNDWDDGVSIGNGSEVEVAFDVYDTPMGKGTRLSGVKVLNLVEYEPEESGEPRAPKLPF
jgi:hypothetical protein